MTWDNVGKYLDKFKNLKPPQKFMQDEVAEVIQRLLNVSIESENINERGGVLYIKIKNPSVKNEIFMNKNKILEELSKKLGSRTPKDIKF